MGTGEGARRASTNGRPLRGRLFRCCRSVAELLPVITCFSRAFGCCPKGLYVPAPARLAPSKVGGLRAENSSARILASSDPSKIFRPLPKGRQASVGNSSASFASSQNNGGEGSWPLTTSNPTHQERE